MTACRLPQHRLVKPCVPSQNDRRPPQKPRQPIVNLGPKRRSPTPQLGTAQPVDPARRLRDVSDRQGQGLEAQNSARIDYRHFNDLRQRTTAVRRRCGTRECTSDASSAAIESDDESAAKNVAKTGTTRHERRHRDVRKQGPDARGATRTRGSLAIRQAGRAKAAAGASRSASKSASRSGPGMYDPQGSSNSENPSLRGALG